MLHQKNNLAPDAKRLAYMVVPQENGSPALEWEPEYVEADADEVLNRGNHQPTELNEAAEWVKGILKDGPVLVGSEDNPGNGTIRRQAIDAGFSLATIRRAKAKAGAESFKRDFAGEWAWRLKDQAKVFTPYYEDPQDRNVSAFGGSEPLV